MVKMTRVEKKKRRNKIILYVLLIIAFFIASFAIVRRMDFFNIKDIKVAGLKHNSDLELLKDTEIKKGSNIFRFSIKKEEKKILKNPYILELEIGRKLPNRVNIKVKEKDEYYKLVKDGKNIILDKDGIILAIRDNKSDENLTIFSQFDFKSPVTNKDIGKNIWNFMKNEKEIKDIIESNKSVDVLSSFQIVKLEAGEIILVDYNKKEVDFGRLRDTEYRFNLLKEILAYIVEEDIIYDKILMNKGDNPIIVRGKEEG